MQWLQEEYLKFWTSSEMKKKNFKKVKTFSETFLQAIKHFCNFVPW